MNFVPQQEYDMVGVQRSVSNILHFRSQHKWDRLQRKLTKSTFFVLKNNLTKTLMLKKGKLDVYDVPAPQRAQV
ncbi:hypothetical protein Hanom_Chr01g00050981 [Helianthus anomalus]